MVYRQRQAGQDESHGRSVNRQLYGSDRTRQTGDQVEPRRVRQEHGKNARVFQQVAGSASQRQNRQVLQPAVMCCQAFQQQARKP